MIRCSHCGYDVPQGDNFCGRCGEKIAYSRPITTHLGNSLPLRTQPATWAGRVSRSIIRLSHVTNRPQGLHTIVRTIREAVEQRDKAQRRLLVATYTLVVVLMTLTLTLLYVELRMHGVMH